MRILRNIAVLVALATLGFAVGDWASHPNLLGVVGLMVLVLAFGFLLSVLFRPAREREPRAPEEPRRRRAPAAAVAGWGAEEAVTARERRLEKRAPGGRIDLNSAGAGELATLPGVGPVQAQRIVEEREAGGPFATVSDLARVPGFNPAKVRALADRARV